VPYLPQLISAAATWTLCECAEAAALRAAGYSVLVLAHSYGGIVATEALTPDLLAASLASPGVVWFVLLAAKHGSRPRQSDMCPLEGGPEDMRVLRTGHGERAAAATGYGGWCGSGRGSRAVKTRSLNAGHCPFVSVPDQVIEIVKDVWGEA
jgi:pimeloyl-ACP methyl ester carboxylesterase